LYYLMGGLYVQLQPGKDLEPEPAHPKNQATNIPGLYAAGEVDHSIHGGNRLGANSLVSCIYGGMLGGPSMISYARSAPRSAEAEGSKHFEAARKHWVERFEQIRKMDGKENPYQLGKELGDSMTENVTVVRYNDKLKKTMEKVRELRERWEKCNVLDTSSNANRSLSYVNQLWNMLELGEVITYSALLRDESRGAHYKPDFSLPEPKTKDPSQDPEWMALWRARHQKWAKTTMATYAKDGPQIGYEDISTPVLDPEPRWYA